MKAKKDDKSLFPLSKYSRDDQRGTRETIKTWMKKLLGKSLKEMSEISSNFWEFSSKNTFDQVEPLLLKACSNHLPICFKINSSEDKSTISWCSFWKTLVRSKLSCLRNMNRLSIRSLQCFWIEQFMKMRTVTFLFDHKFQK